MSKIIFILLLYLTSVSVTAQNSAFIRQKNGLLDSEINLVQIGENNLLTGFVTDNNFVEHAFGAQNAAYQYSIDGGINNLNVKQLNSTKRNEIILSQEAFSNNNGIFKQENGSHSLLLKEISIKGSNNANISQINGSGYINLEQKAYSDNIIPSAENTILNNPGNYPGIYQEGPNNYIFGASEVNLPIIGSIAIPRPDLPAQQIAENGENWLEIWQTGGFNVVALHQEAETDNKALIHQYNGFNLAIIFQRAAGSNYVLLEQAGGMAAYVYQNGGLNNEAILRQY